MVPLSALVSILKRAHAGELAAQLAYEGHWRSLSDSREAAEVRAIALEEAEHRRVLRQMLEVLGEKPRLLREVVFRLIGLAVGSLCRVGGWFLPMYGAGWLESGNIREYEEAAGLAAVVGREDFAEALLQMAEVEWEHERYFREKVTEAGRWIFRLLPIWPAPPPFVRRAFPRQGTAP